MKGNNATEVSKKGNQLHGRQGKGKEKEMVKQVTETNKGSER
jgi:hypothetical protein